MYDIRITKINIEKVRHLKDIEIPVTDSDGERKHLIITGKNGSGKTSLLEAISKYLHYLAVDGAPEKQMENYNHWRNQMDAHIKKGASENDIQFDKEQALNYKKAWTEARHGIDISMTVPLDGVKTHFKNGEFVFAYYKDNRIFEAKKPEHVEKVELQETYPINPRQEEAPRYKFIQYLLDMKVTEALAARSTEKERQQRAEIIRKWFNDFEALLQNIFNDCGGKDKSGEKHKTVKLDFDEETYAFTIHEGDKEPFDFNNLSAGFAAVLDIVVDLIMRMEKHTGGTFRFDLPGIVLIDEIETHLHLELQRAILPFLTTFFPNIQFIVSTHSPYVVTSVSNALVYDLEAQESVTDLSEYSADDVAEGYFGAASYSAKMREKLERYKELLKKENITDDERADRAELRMELDMAPKKLATSIIDEFDKIEQGRK